MSGELLSRALQPSRAIARPLAQGLGFADVDA